MNPKIVTGAALDRLRIRPRRSAAALAMIGLAAAAMVVILSFFGGLYRTYVTRVTEVGPQVTMTAESPQNVRRDLLLDDRDSLPAVIELVKRVDRRDRPRIRNAMTYTRAIEELYGRKITGVSPFLATQALAAFGASQATIPIRGVLADRERRISNLDDHLISGSLRRLAMEWNRVLLGRRLAEQLGIETGERMRLVSLIGESYVVQVAGIYELGVEEYDRSALVNLRLAQALEHALPGEANGIALQLRNPAEAPDVAADLATLTGRRVETWDQTHAGALTSLASLRDLATGAGASLLLVAALASAYLLVPLPGDERLYDRRLPDPARRRVALPVVEGLLLGGAAGVAGVALGAVAAGIVSFLPGSLLDAEIPLLSLRSLPSIIELRHLLIGFGSALAAGLIATSVRQPGRPESRPADESRTVAGTDPRPE